MIGARVYSSKKAAQAEVYAMRERFYNGTATAEDDEFLRDLVALHPDAPDKVRAGIERFEVRKNMNNFGFWIIRIDGTETDFSFIKGLNGCGIEDLARSAMRNAVRDQLAPVREAAIATGACCPILGEPLTADNCHVDHEDPLFIEIADEFAAAEGGYEHVATVAVDGQFGRSFSHPEQ